MKTVLTHNNDSLWGDTKLDDDLEYTQLTKEQVAALELNNSPKGLWTVVKIQMIAGLIVTAFSLLFGVWSAVCAACGVLSVCVPTIIFVWRMSVVTAKAYSPNFTLVNFYFWEIVKIICIIAMLIAAFILLKPLIWQSLLAGFIVTIKAYALGSWLSLRKK